LSGGFSLNPHFLFKISSLRWHNSSLNNYR
jgi:hypothetical protein